MEKNNLMFFFSNVTMFYHDNNLLIPDWRVIYDYEIICSSKDLTNELEEMITSAEIPYKRGLHWTTDAGYRETWGQVMDYRDKGALCVEMEGVGLFTIANYRKCVATGIYVVSDVYSEDDWKLGWEGNDIKRAVGAVIDMIIESIR